MTIEGRPEIKEDWEVRYAQQRKDRLTDAIDDYLQDTNLGPRQIYEEILQNLDELIVYHKNNLKRVEDLKNLMLGYRDIDTLDDIKLPDRY